MTEPPEAAGGAVGAGAGAGGWRGGAAAAWPAGTAAVTPMPFKLLLDEAARWTRRWLRAIYPRFAVPVVVVTAGNSTLQALMRPADPASAAADPWQAIGRNCSIALLALLLWLPLMMLYWAMSAAAVDAVMGREVSFSRSWRFILRPGVLGAQLLVMLCVGAAAVCCVVPVLYVAPLLGLTLQAMAAEGVTGTAALGRSAELTRHNPRRLWNASPIVKLLALSAVVTVITVLVSLVVQLPLSLAQGLDVFRKMAAGEDVQSWSSRYRWLQVPLSCLASLLTSVVSLYSAFAHALLFFDLRARREGDDLRRAVADMTGGAGPEPPVPAPLPPPATPALPGPPPGRPPAGGGPLP
jgi:hypothetical protein